MKSKLILFFITALLLPLMPTKQLLAAEPQQLTVGDLHDFCVASDNASKSVCKFYILGVFEGAKLSAALSKDRTHFCIPDDLAGNKMEFMVKARIGEDLMFYPKDRDESAVGFIFAVIVKDFPCGKQSTN